MKAFPLSPVDYIFTGVGSQPITFCFYYNKNLDPDLLRKGLNETLNYFPILRSKLVKISKTDYEFHTSDDGLTFQVSDSNVAFEKSKSIEKYIMPVRTIEEKPLTKITLTQTPKGSFLAVSVSHALVDGFSFFYFFSSWARICRGESIIIKPSLERTVFSSYLKSSKKTFTSNDIYSNCGLFYGNKRSNWQGGPINEERILISKDTIRDYLKEVENERDISLSENDILTALLWKNYIPSWIKENDNPVTYVTCPFDFRRALSDFPNNYFGCSICFTTASIDLSSLSKVSIGDLAILVRNSVNKVRSDYVVRSLQTLESLRKQKGLEVMEEIHLRHPNHGMIVTNLTRLPIRELDFGAGIPVDFLTYVDVLGGAAILPAVKGVEILVAHPPK
ncbi:MAG: acyltransferase [Candidatus Aminicenantaceae bacterium]